MPEEVCLLDCQWQRTVGIQPVWIFIGHEFLTGQVVIKLVLPTRIVHFPALYSSPMLFAYVPRLVCLVYGSGDESVRIVHQQRAAS